MKEKIMIASDIHGSAYWCKKLIAAYESEKPEKLVLLGDILYHGPRNPLPDGYAPQEVAAMLNSLKNNLLCVRGNCDSEVDQMVLDFPITAYYAMLLVGGKTFCATHGHLFNAEQPLPLSAGNILLNGHFHLPCHKQIANGVLYVNCGSVSLPKENTPHSYLVFESGKLLWKDLGNECRIFDECI